jgi:hypothetical protein
MMDKKTLEEQIKIALDGRTQRWLALEIKMPESDLSKKIKGAMPFLDQEIKSIEKRLNFKISK